MECLECDCNKMVVRETATLGGTVYRCRKCPECGCSMWTEEIEVEDTEGLKRALAYKKARYRSGKAITKT